MSHVSSVRTKIIVISMADAKERRSRFEDRARNADVAWSFFPARIGLHPSLSYDEKNAIVAKGRPLRKGELGCYSSHYAAWEQLQIDDCDQYIVLEDDVIVDWTFIRKVVDIDFATLRIPYLRLYYKWPAKQTMLMANFIDRARSIVELSGYPYGTQGYMITKAGAGTLLAHCRVVRRPIDDEMDRSWVHGVRNLAIFPFPIMEESADSTIGETRFEEFQVPLHLKLRIRIVRQVDRWRYRGVRTVRWFENRQARWRVKR
jgi:glycosyl transferase, family 25